MKRLKLVSCLRCNKLIKPTMKSNKKRVRFCSHECSSYGKFNGNWKGGRRKTGGKHRTGVYIRLWIPPNERPYKNYRPREHRYIMEQYLGRKLKYNELIHHKNYNQSDNRIKNLEVMSRSSHQRFHVLLRHGKIYEAYESLKQKLS